MNILVQVFDQYFTCIKLSYYLYLTNFNYLLQGMLTFPLMYWSLFARCLMSVVLPRLLTKRGRFLIYSLIVCLLTTYTVVSYLLICLNTVAAIESDDKIIKISLLIIKIVYNRKTYKKKSNAGNYLLVYSTIRRNK